MYIPKLYGETDLPLIEKFIREHSFATLVSHQENTPIATHIPLELDINAAGKQVLFGHLSKGNKQWKNFNGSDPLLAIFQGAHTYISPSWYNHVNVPTWNYISVHVYGTARVLEGEEMFTLLKNIMDKYESPMAQPRRIEDFPEKFYAAETRGLVAFEMSIERIEAAYKLSQNREDEDYKNIIIELKKLNEVNATRIAEEMEKRKQ